MRYAIYYTPPHDDPLTIAAENWLGRSAFGRQVGPSQAVPLLSVEDVAYQTAAARRYGLHATLKAPFSLAPERCEQDLVAALASYCGRLQPFRAPRLVVSQIDGFFALVPEERSEALVAFAGDVVAAFDIFRAPLTEREMERRAPDTLSPGQLKNLYQWGYPYVFSEFRFHMTLTGRVATADAARLRQAIEDHFGPLLDEPFEIGSLALFVEPEPGAPFSVHSIYEFGSIARRKSA